MMATFESSSSSISIGVLRSNEMIMVISTACHDYGSTVSRPDRRPNVAATTRRRVPRVAKTAAKDLSRARRLSVTEATS